MRRTPAWQKPNTTIHEIRYRFLGERETWNAVFIGDKSFEDFVKRTKREVKIISHKKRSGGWF